MTTLREAAQNVVEVWKLYGTTESLRGWMEILEAALAEPVQEPVADQFADVSKMVQEPVAWTHINGTSDTKRHQPQRKPLTEEEIYSLFRTVASPVMFARAIERAHGIT